MRENLNESTVRIRDVTKEDLLVLYQIVQCDASEPETHIKSMIGPSETAENSVERVIGPERHNKNLTGPSNNATCTYPHVCLNVANLTDRHMVTVPIICQ